MSRLSRSCATGSLNSPTIPPTRTIPSSGWCWPTSSRNAAWRRRVREKAIAIIDNGSDLAMLEKLGLQGTDLRKRAHALGQLRARLVAAPTVSRPRATLKAPQPYVLEVATLYACPTRGSAAINP